MATNNDFHATIVPLFPTNEQMKSNTIIMEIEQKVKKNDTHKKTFWNDKITMQLNWLRRDKKKRKKKKEEIWNSGHQQQAKEPWHHTDENMIKLNGMVVIVEKLFTIIIYCILFYSHFVA